MNYTVLPGKSETFEKAFASILNVMKDMDGHIETHLYVDVSDANAFLIMSEWSSREAYDAFLKSDRFRKVVDWGKEQILAGPPKHEIYEK